MLFFDLPPPPPPHTPGNFLVKQKLLFSETIRV